MSVQTRSGEPCPWPLTNNLVTCVNIRVLCANQSCPRETCVSVTKIRPVPFPAAPRKLARAVNAQRGCMSVSAALGTCAGRCLLRGGSHSANIYRRLPGATLLGCLNQDRPDPQVRPTMSQIASIPVDGTRAPARPSQGCGPCPGSPGSRPQRRLQSPEASGAHLLGCRVTES